MDERRRRSWRSFAAGAVALLVLLVLIGAAIILFGGYDVSASSAHLGVTRWAFNTAMENSVRRQAEGIEPPTRFTPAQVLAGAGHYKAMCQQCHGGPGVPRDEFAQGLNPRPPELARTLDEWSPGDVFWIVRNGIRMTAMPAFGDTHSDADIWNIVAFVEQLPRMSPEQYRAYPAEDHEADGEHAHGHEHGHDHDHAHEAGE